MGQEGGDGGWVADMDIIDSSSSSHDSQAQLHQAAGVGSLRLIQLTEKLGKVSFTVHFTWIICLGSVPRRTNVCC